MSKLTFTLYGREALPVRAIPYVTGWQMSPDVVARSMAKIEPPPPFPALLHGLRAYHLPDDIAVEMLPREWDATVANLEGYETELKQQHPDDAIGYAAWRKDSAGQLPAGVFVWLDEFASERTADRAKVLRCEQRHGDDELILAPVLGGEIRTMINEGFDILKLYAINNPQTEAMKREHLIAHYDVFMHAATWVGCASVKPDEAAMLLCRIDPHERNWRGEAPNPENIYVDDDRTSPDRFRVLRRAFEDVAETDPKPRTLLDWRDVARRKSLRYHEWIDEYSPITTGNTEKVGAGGTAPRESKQAETITTNRLKNRSNMLDAVIELAISKAIAPDDNQNVWAALVAMAEASEKPAPLIGYSSDGIQYRGKKYEESGEPDTFKANNLRDRMARAKKR
jgi:hypothetical protein